MTLQASSKDKAVEVIIGFNDALNRRDLDTMMGLMAEDCIFENTYPPPDGTCYKGQAAIRAFWEDFFRSSNQAQFDIEEIFGLENRCVMRWIYHWVDQAGQAGHIRGVDLYKLTNDLIAEKLSYVKG
jgi:ketosteroid isomerase-like protein